MQILMGRRTTTDSDLPVMRDIVARVDALSELINDLMVFARPRPLQIGRVLLRSLVQDAVTMVRRDPIGGGVEFEIQGPDIPIEADSEALRSAILNVLLNAAQAMNGHGRITTALCQQDGLVSVAMRDTGPGIPMELRSQVLEPFVTTKARGGGLGLPIARRTAELHGGTLTIDCPPDGGTVVTLELRPTPLAAVRRQAEPADAASPGQTSRSGTAPGHD
jgi:signal transduction histidine kinase